MPATERRVAVVTGAGSGIGRASAIALAEEGFHVVFTGRRGGKVAEAAELTASAEAREMDVTDPAQVDTVVADVASDHGRVDLLVNSAGLFGTQQPIVETGVSDWNAIWQVNVTGTFIASRAAMRVMATQEPRGGRIINLGSVSAQVPRPHAAAYTASKNAVTGLTRSFALEGRDLDIAVGQIDVGNAATPMTRAHELGALQPDGSVRPEPSIDVGHVASTIAFIASMPPTVSVPFMTLMATAMPLMGRG